MSPTLQVKLLRVLQERELERVGDSRTIKVDVRVVAATNESLEDLVEEGKFREDLFYRLNVVPVPLPPLRERREDIALLVRFFLKRAAEANRCDPPELTPEVLEALDRYDWPGNVRELENTIERLVVLYSGKTVSVRDVRLGRAHYTLRTAKPKPNDPQALIQQLVRTVLQGPLPLEKLHRKLVGRLERELIEQVMRLCDQVQVKAARILDINRNTLHNKLDQYEKDDAEETGG